MEFGRIPEEELDKIDFKLPPGPLFNKQILEGKPVANPKVYVGCAKWGRVEWLGKIYPPKTKEKDFLDQYVHHYNSIELNATHYKIYGPTGYSEMGGESNWKGFFVLPKDVPGSYSPGKLERKRFYTE